MSYRIHVSFTKKEMEAMYKFIHAIITPENKKDDPNLRNSLDVLDKELHDTLKYHDFI